jgi:hypothetical protein
LRDGSDQVKESTIDKLEEKEREAAEEEAQAAADPVLFDPGYERTKGMVERPRTVGFVEERGELGEVMAVGESGEGRSVASVPVMDSLGMQRSRRSG